jgi:hypothetical protein
MAVALYNFPATVIVDGILSYLQYSFGNAEIVPADYRWSSDERKSRIRISGPFVIDSQKPNSAPFIMVERGPLSFSNSTIDNVKSSDPNVFTNTEKVDWMDGVLNITCGCGPSASSEATNMANFIAILIQANKKPLMKQLNFLRRLDYIDLGPETPVMKDTEIRRWEVTLRFQISLQMGWIERKVYDPDTLADKVEYFNTDDFFSSSTGILTDGSDILYDPGADFGLLNENSPQLLESELSKGWYYIQLNGLPQNYRVAEIVDNNRLRLLTRKVDDTGDEAYVAPETATDVQYKLVWNTVHIHCRVPTNNS